MTGFFFFCASLFALLRRTEAFRLFAAICFCVLVQSCGDSDALYGQAPRAQCVLAVNQLGYAPNAQKIALALGAVRREDTLQFGSIADIVDLSRNAVVLRVAMSEPIIDAQSGDTVRRLDFSIVSKPGRYVVRYGGVESYPFRIGVNVYDSLFASMLRSFYLQRCGERIDDRLHGASHEACHTEDGFLARADALNASGARIKAVGGWHDAGDYGKYVATTAVSVARLLSIAEEALENRLRASQNLSSPSKVPERRFYERSALSDSVQIPESGNGAPDILDEARVGLRWLLTMQRSDGAIYRKLSGARWSELIPPEAERQRRFVYGVSSPETAKFAGAMAHAARIFREIQPAFADSCLRASRLAWAYLQSAKPMTIDWQPSDDGGSGKYLESEVDTEASLFTEDDDRFYAAAELFITTRDSVFLRAAESIWQKGGEASEFRLFEWKNAAPLGMTNLDRAAEPSFRAELRRKILRRADETEKIVNASGYRYGNKRIVWGSNKMIAEEAIALLHAYRLTQHRAYLDCAQDQLDFLLGRNPFGVCFVTGFGAKPVSRICHTFARARGFLGDKMIPGLLAGGANELAQAGIAPKYRGLKSYADDERSYATNENAIDYNASALALIALLMGELEREREKE
jgi:endoglucanase